MTATVFLVLLAGHLLGDWVAQTDWQATTKTRSWAALTAHVASYHLLMGLLLLIPILRDGWPAPKALAALAASAVTHASSTGAGRCARSCARPAAPGSQPSSGG
jgi:Protein of unknown function (DUF3307)